jgi:class 3 adenylate cyclase/ATP/maltotriose-dependent transcriptional regulator MalT
MTHCSACGAENPPDARFCNACGARLDASPVSGAPIGSSTGDVRAGERRVVTMLFCDVRGSTAMAEELDPEDWTDVMNEAFAHLIEPVVRHEGTVARLMGDAILAFFGAPTAHEDDPQRAVMAGLEIVSSIAAFREKVARERGLDLNVRVGINTGPVVVGDVGSELKQEYSAMGDAVNVAARMEQTAEPGSVQITEDTYRLVADLFEVEPLGGVELKGKRRPVESYRVLGRLDAPWTVRAARRLDAPLVGREEEMRVIRDALEGAREGRGRVLLLSGDPGLGKSRLIEEANAIWSELEPGDDRRWDFWRCVPYDTMQPYAQYRRLIRERAGVKETDPAETVRAKIAVMMRAIALEGWEARSERVARALLGVELPDEPPLEGEEFQRAATDLVVGSTVAQGGRRLIVFEDLHWCDHASLDLVRATTELVADAPIVVLITFRPDREAVSWGLRGWVEAELQEHAIVLDLEPLSAEQSGELIGAFLPVPGMTDADRQRILGKTEGNPLFLQEVARALIDGGLVERADGGWRLTGNTAELAIPDTIQSLITVGLDRLPGTARGTAQTAAVIGRTFAEELLVAVVGRPEVRDDLHELVRRDLIRVSEDGSQGDFTFRHALTQEAAYGTLLAKHRRATHRRVAEVLEETAGERLEEIAPQLVRHFSEAREDGPTLTYAAMAGDAAARLHANAEAEAHYRTGLDVARRIGAPSSLLRTMYERRGSALELIGRYDDAIANYEEMQDEAVARGDEAMELAANSMIALLYSTATPKFDPPLGRRLSEEAVVMARRIGDRAAEARALWNIVVANVYGGGDASRAVEAGEASLAIARELGEREQVAFTLNDVCRAYMAKGDFATAAQRLAEARLLWEELDNRPMLGENLTVGSSMHMFHGDFAAALADARQAAEISASIGNAWGESHALLTIYRVEVEFGQLGAAIDTVQRSMELGERGGFAYAGIATRADIARVIAFLGDGERALALADEALAIALERVPPAASLAHVARADALIALGRQAEAHAPLDEVDLMMLPEPDRTFLMVAACTTRSRLALNDGDVDEAEAIARGALEDLRTKGVVVLEAVALVALARAHLAADRLEEAGGELAEAIEHAERLGERKVLWEALALSADLNAPRRAEEESAELRARALTIVEEIAAGLADADLRRRFLSRDDVHALEAAGR